MADQREITAEELESKFKEISVAEFFEKNRHLLGYENPTKALLTIVKEGVDNALDATNEAGILPEIKITLRQTTPDRFHITIEDNGPGIVESKVPFAFGKLLYGTKFHRLRQSISGEEAIFIRQNGIIKSVKIGEFVDSLLDNKSGDLKEIISMNIETLSFDPKNYKISWMPISHVIRHNLEDSIYKVKLESGREIKTTGCHSIFTLDTTNLIVRTKETSEIKEGDYVVVAKQIPESDNFIGEINVFDYIGFETAKKHRWYIYGLEERVFQFLKRIGDKIKIKNHIFYQFTTSFGNFKLRSDHLNLYENKKMLPMHLVIAFDIAKEFDLRKSVIKTYQVGGEPYDFPTNIPIDREFVRFLGFWVAEGHSGKRRIVFDFGAHEKNYIEEIERISKKIFFRDAHNDPDEKKNKMRLIIDSTILYELFKAMKIKSGAHQKNIPFLIYNIQSDLKLKFLKALYAGDGCLTEDRKMLTYTTVSRNLISDIIFLNLMMNVFSSVSYGEKKGLGKYPSKIYRMNLYGNELNKLWFDFKFNRNSWCKYTGIPSVLIKSLGAFNDLPKIMDRKIAQKYLRFKEHRTNNCYFSILNSLKSNPGLGTGQKYYPSGRSFYISQLQNANFVGMNGNSYFITDEGNEFLFKIEKLKRLINSDFCFLKVKKIEKINSNEKYVYDISIPGCENFVAGLGGIICHNSRGTQGIGIHGAVLYSQLTTGKHITVTTSTGKAIHVFEMMINVTKNEPHIISKKELKNSEKWHGLKIEMEAEGKYIERYQSIPEYLKQTAISNPYAHIIYEGPNGKQEFKRNVNEIPKQPKEIKPHPYGVEIGIMRRMLSNTKAKNIIGFLTTEFSRVGRSSAEQICKLAKIEFNRNPKQLTHEESEKMHKAMQMIKLISPPTNCLSPLREHLITEGMKKELPAEYFVAITRPPSVYRGNPFQVEVGLAYGGQLQKDQSSQILRFANKVPLLYHQSDCATNEAIVETDWRRYGFSQSTNSIPVGPLAILIHFASVWVPYTSEGKQAIANYTEIVKEMKLALQEAGRKLAIYVHQKKRLQDRRLRGELFEKYIPELAESLAKLTDKQKAKIIAGLEAVLKKNNIIIQREDAKEDNENVKKVEENGEKI